MTRLCAPIEGTDAARLADCLGLDPSRFRGASSGNSVADAREDALVSGSAYFDDEDRFKVHCTSESAVLLFPLNHPHKIVCAAKVTGWSLHCT